MSIRAALIKALHDMTEEQALALVHALGQWADNERCRDDLDPEDIPEAERAQLAIAETFVEAGELALITLADRPPAPLPDPSVWVTL